MNQIKKLIFVLLWVAFLGLGSSHALLLEFINLNLDGLIDRFAETHFMAPGNDFVGAIFWLPTKSLVQSEEITLNGETKHCRKLVKWMYYNSQRWERLWPLDNYTLNTLRRWNASYDQLTMTWWLYTVCDENLYGIFGQVKYDRSGTVSSVTAWTKLDYLWNWLSWDFADSFEYFNNMFPLWYIVDSVWWIWFVWGSLTWHNCLICMLNQNCTDPSCHTPPCSGDSIGELFVYSWWAVFEQSWCAYSFSGWSGLTGEIGDIQRWITIQWTVWLSQALEDQDRQTLLGNYNQKIAVVNVPKVNISTLLNKVRKNAQDLCRWRTNYQGNLVSIPSEWDVLCINYDAYATTNKVTIDLSKSTEKAKYLWKTLIVSNADIYIKHSMLSTDDPLDLFLDHGNLYLDWVANPAMASFSTEGYPSTNANDIVTKWLFLKWNIIVNGLILWNSGTAISEVPHKLYVHGKLNSLNTPVEPSAWRKTQIDDLFGVLAYDNWINLQHVFTRYCNPITWSWSDGVSCWADQFADSPLVIIWQDFDSKLY